MFIYYIVPIVTAILIPSPIILKLNCYLSILIVPVITYENNMLNNNNAAFILKCCQYYIIFFLNDAASDIALVIIIYRRFILILNKFTHPLLSFCTRWL